MTMYTIDCSDKSSDCKGTLRTEIPLQGLRGDQLREISENEGTVELELTAVQVERNLENIPPEDLAMKEDDGSLFYEVSGIQTVCSGCGSDVSRDSEGKVIT